MPLSKTLLALPLAAALAAASCGGGDAGGGDSSKPAKPAGATIKAFDFQPDPIRIRAGQTVEWINHDGTAHTVTSGPRSGPDGRFDHRLSGSGASARQRFAKPGRYAYFCTLHSGPGMTGEVIVR